MADQVRDDVRNIAIIAHVDHGKSTLVDAMLWQSSELLAHDYTAERIADAIGHEREKEIAVTSKITSMGYRGIRINVVDTPGHANFGGSVEALLRMVDGVLLLVDAGEGPLPQTRYVLRKALEAQLAPILVINKVDLPGARPDEVLDEVRELFVDLDAGSEQLEFPVVYCNARRGLCGTKADAVDQSLMPLFDTILRSVPAPTHDPGNPLQFQVTALDYDDIAGRLALGRVFGGRLRKGARVAHCRLDGEQTAGSISGVFAYEGTRRFEVDEAGPGEIVAITGPESVRIGETIADVDDPRPLDPVKPDEPTLALALSVNDSPLAGLDGEHVSAPELRERLWRELLTNVSIRLEDTDSPDTLRLSGRAELQLAIMIEMMRREGYEFLVGRPQILTREIDGRLHEPMEVLVLDCPEPHAGVVTEKVAARRGRMTKMVNHGTGRVRMEFRIPSRGLIGFRTEFLSDTRGTGILNHLFDGFDEWQGEIAHRTSGSMIADRPGRATAFAISNYQGRGSVFVAPGDDVYEGMIVGENSRADDLDVNITKEKRTTVLRGEVEPTPRLIPPRSLSLEQAIEFILDDELVEVTPRAIRMRKKILPSSVRERKA